MDVFYTRNIKKREDFVKNLPDLQLAFGYAKEVINLP